MSWETILSLWILFMTYVKQLCYIILKSNFYSYHESVFDTFSRVDNSTEYQT